MSQASVTGKGGVQVSVTAHGETLAPLNIEPAKDLWAALGRAIQTAERNRDSLVTEAGPRADTDLPAPDEPGSAPREKDPGLPEGVASLADVPTIDETKVKPGEEVRVGREDLVQAPTAEAQAAAQQVGTQPVPDPDALPESVVPVVTDFDQMTKPELQAFLEASGRDVKASASKAELVAEAEQV